MLYFITHIVNAMVRLTFYGGVNEIGGNKILLEDDGTRILFDFGASFGQAGKYFSEFLQPRKLNRHPLLVILLPLPNIFDF